MSVIKDPMTGATKEKSVTSFSPTAQELIDQNVMSTAVAYKQRVDEHTSRLASAKTNHPIGHAPEIPKGKLAPIVEAAKYARMPQPDFAQAARETQQSEEEGDWYQNMPTTPPPIPGVGSGYAVNQAMARGELDGPVNMRQAKDIEADVARKMQSKHNASEQRQEQEQHSNPDLPSNKEELEKTEKILAERKFDDALPFDFEALQQARLPLLNPERKKAIEGRLSELNFEDLITKREITQDVPIVPGKFTVGYRTVREKEHVWVLQHLYEVTGLSSAAHIEELGAAYRLVCAVRSINGKPLPDHRENIGQPNEVVSKEKFEKKLDILMGFPVHVFADIGVNFNWFSDRVTKLFSVDNLKNG